MAEGNGPEERRFSRLWNQNKQSPAPATQQPTAADNGLSVQPHMGHLTTGSIVIVLTAQEKHAALHADSLIFF